MGPGIVVPPGKPFGGVTFRCHSWLRSAPRAVLHHLVARFKKNAGMRGEFRLVCVFGQSLAVWRLLGVSHVLQKCLCAQLTAHRGVNGAGRS